MRCKITYQIKSCYTTKHSLNRRKRKILITSIQSKFPFFFVQTIQGHLVWIHFLFLSLIFLKFSFSAVWNISLFLCFILILYMRYKMFRANAIPRQFLAYEENIINKCLTSINNVEIQIKHTKSWKAWQTVNNL